MMARAKEWLEVEWLVDGDTDECATRDFPTDALAEAQAFAATVDGNVNLLRERYDEYGYLDAEVVETYK